MFKYLIYFCFFILISSQLNNTNITTNDKLDNSTKTEKTDESSNTKKNNQDELLVESMIISIDDRDEEENIVEDEEEEDNAPIIQLNREETPEAYVVLPIRRAGSVQGEMNVAPCGGVMKRKADMLTNKGSILNVIWETRKPSINGNCTVKLSPGLEHETNFTLLSPVSVQTYNDGSFPCGRIKGFESQQFTLPNDYVCDQCTLQWAWTTSAGKIYSCSDIIINGMKIDDCIARCQNGGACFNGKCLCDVNFYGEFCQNNSMIIILIVRKF